MFLILALLVSTSLFAQNPTCPQILRIDTIPQVKAASAARAEARFAQVPQVSFDNIEVQAKVVQVGETGPQALNEMLPMGTSFASAPAPTSVSPVAVTIFEEARSFPLHVDFLHNGKKANTTAYITAPLSHVKTKGKHAINLDQYKDVDVHLHGGGTPNGTGANANSLKLGVPIVAIDLPGHGTATKDLTGIEFTDEMAWWIVSAIEKLIQPGVRIHISGHSWGAMFVLWLHQNSDHPRLKHFASFISLSPGIDITMGTGSLEERLAFDKYYEQEYVHYKPRIAVGDFEFLNNLLDAGKDSDIGAYATAMFSLGYKTPPYTPEMQRKLKPLLVIVGKYDGLVRVGRDQQYDTIFGQLQGPSRYVVIDKAITWKSKDENDLQEIGHQTFDARESIGGAFIVYRAMNEFILKGQPPVENEDSTGDKALDMIEKFFRNYANFFGFRELIKNRIEHVKVDSPEHGAMKAKQAALENFATKTAALEKELARVTTTQHALPEVSAALEQLREKLGLVGRVTLKIAQEELALPAITDERRAELKAYLDKIDRAELDSDKNFEDKDFDKIVARKNIEFADILALAKIKSVADYEAEYKRITALDKNARTEDEEKVRKGFARLEAGFAKDLGEHGARKQRAKDAAQKAIPLPAGIDEIKTARRLVNADRSPKRIQALKDFIAQYAQVEKEAFDKLVEELTTRLGQVRRVEGFTTSAAARAEADRLKLILDMKYVPEGRQDIAAVLADVRASEQKIEKLERGDKSAPLTALQAKADKTSVELQRVTRAWEELWKKEKLTLKSDLLDKKTAEYLRIREHFRELYYAYEGAKTDMLTDLMNKGQLTFANVLVAAQGIEDKRSAKQEAKIKFLKARHELEQLRLQEALGGNLKGDEDDLKLATESAKKLGGAGDNLQAQFRDAAEKLATRQQDLANEEFRLSELNMKYLKLMRQAGEPAVFNIERVNVWDALNQPLSSLRAALSSNRGQGEREPVLYQAFNQTMVRWGDMLARLRSEIQPKEGIDY